MKARHGWTFGVAAALAVLIVLGLFRMQRSGAGDRVSATSAVNETETPQEQDSVVAEPARQQVDVSSVALGPGAIAEAPPPVAALLPGQVPATPMSQALEDLQMPPIPELLETEKEFAGQSTDPVWSTATEARILDQIAGIAGLKLASLDVECRTTLCRLQFVQPGTVPGPPSAVFPAPDRATANGLSVTDLIPATGLKPRWVIAVRDRNGTPVSLAYLERSSDAAAAPGQ